MFLGMTEWTWAHVLAVPSLLLAAAVLPTTVLVFLIMAAIAIHPTWFRYVYSNWTLLLIGPIKAIIVPIMYRQPWMVTDMTDECRASYAKHWWGGDDPDDSDLGE